MKSFSSFPEVAARGHESGQFSFIVYHRWGLLLLHTLIQPYQNSTLHKERTKRYYKVMVTQKKVSKGKRGIKF